MKNNNLQINEHNASNDMVRIYMGDWYLNAGIVGFLKVLCDGDFEKLSALNNRLTIEENYIELHVSLLDRFQEKFKKQLFLSYFNKNQYLAYIKNALDLEKSKKGYNENKARELLDKFPFKGLLDLFDCDTSNIDGILSYRLKIETMNENSIYENVKNSEFLEYFVNTITMGIIGLSKLDSFVQNSIQLKYIPKNTKDKLCIICQERKADLDGDLSNSISNIIGFNKDNSNWIWGFDSGKVKLCSICSIVYLCASVGLVYSKKDSSYLNSFYFINHNGNIRALINSYVRFQSEIKNIKKQKPIYPIMVKEVVRFAKSQQADKTIHNISFFEVIENPITGGKSTKGYNIYPFSISKKLASFINKNLDSIPNGYYKADDNFFNLEEEVLRLTLDRKLGYRDIDRLIRIHIAKNGFFNAYTLINWILKYINYQKGATNMDLEKIAKKGFGNGKELRSKLGVERENQVDGLVYQFLNDLKVANKERFLDKYLRISMANQMESRFGADEMNNKDAFLQFGYSFINGLINNYKSDKGEQQ